MGLFSFVTVDQGSNLHQSCCVAVWEEGPVPEGTWLPMEWRRPWFLQERHKLLAEDS